MVRYSEASPLFRKILWAFRELDFDLAHYLDITRAIERTGYWDDGKRRSTPERTIIAYLTSSLGPSWFESFDDGTYRIIKSRIPRAIEILGGKSSTEIKKPTVSVEAREFDFEEPAIVGAFEGEVRLVLHHNRERDQAAVAKKKALAAQSKRGLKCEACDFDFAEVYGEIGTNLCEVHHTNPLAEGGPRHTQLSDLAIVCSNCHWILHRTNPMWSVAELRDHLQKRGTVYSLANK